MKPTYEGLKVENEYGRAWGRLNLKPTYEGLKVELKCFRYLATCHLKPTYEGLKVVPVPPDMEQRFAFEAYL